MRKISHLLLLFLFFSCSRENRGLKWQMKSFDRRTGQIPVHKFSDAKMVLDRFEKISYQKLPGWYRKLIDPDEKFTASLRSEEWYSIKGEDVLWFVAGEFRIMDFLPEDSLYFYNLDHLGNGGTKLYFLLEPHAIEKFIQLQNELEILGFDSRALKITNGYRYPAFNEKIKGAKASRHIWGEAIDFDVKDINRDGEVGVADKQIVLEILDRKVIRNEGGIGRYPGTESVHLDVRGHRARWDSY